MTSVIHQVNIVMHLCPESRISPRLRWVESIYGLAGNGLGWVRDGSDFFTFSCLGLGPISCAKIDVINEDYCLIASGQYHMRIIYFFVYCSGI